MKAIFLLILSISLLTAETSLAIVTNPYNSIDRIDRTTLKKLYTGRQFQLKGHKVLLINLPYDNPVRIEFENVLGINRMSLKRCWLIAHYKGHRSPKVLKSQRAVAKMIKSIPYAIGYMEPSLAEREGLKIILRLDRQ